MHIQHVLVIDDEPANLDFAVRLFRMLQLDVKGADTAEGALKEAALMPRVDLAIIDHQLPDSTGLDLMKALRGLYPHAVLAMATMHDHRTLIDEAFAVGGDIFLVKPHGFMELYKRIPTVAANGDDSCLRNWIIDSYGPRQRKSTVIPVIQG